MSDARVSIEVRGTSVSPLRTCINSVVEHVLCTENYYCFVIDLTCSALSLSLLRIVKLSIKPVYLARPVCLTLPHIIFHKHVVRWCNDSFIDYGGCNLTMWLQFTA